jgi:hypothetical protein
MPADKVMSEVPSITLADVHAALAYYLTTWKRSGKSWKLSRFKPNRPGEPNRLSVKAKGR